MQIRYADRRRHEEWHPWFAWFPVDIGDDEKECIVWLEMVDRRGDPPPGPECGWQWQYRQLSFQNLDKLNKNA